MLNRTTAPQPQEITHFPFIEPEVFTLDNGIKVYAIGGNEQELVKTDIVMDAGKLHSPNIMAAEAGIDLLFTGAPGKNSEQIANEFDFYGAFNSKSPNYRDAVITNYALARHCSNIYKMLAEYIDTAEFFDNELDIYKFTRTQQLMVAQQKTAYLARKAFAHAVFNGHPYSFFAEPDSIEALQMVDVKYFYVQNKAIKYIVVSGYYNQDVISALNTSFGRLKQSQKPVPSYEMIDGVEKQILVPKADSLQCTIRMGFRTINRTHPDYHKLMVVTTLLGGFFGSRLMKNIREEKGYTYGIHANLSSYIETGVFAIQTDVKKEVYKDTISEIIKEIERLKTEPVSDEEMDILRNYSLGSFLRSIDGAFEIAEKYKSLIDFGLGYNHYNNYIRLLKTMDKDLIMQVARQYLNHEEMYQVVAGV